MQIALYLFGNSIELDIRKVDDRKAVFAKLASDLERMLVDICGGKDCVEEGRFDGRHTGERQMLFEHLELLGEHDLLVLDRGYPASWLMAALQACAIRFCMRIDGIGGKPVTAFPSSGAPEAIVTLPPPNRPDAADYELERAPVMVRLIGVVTPDGRVRVLATNLLDANTAGLLLNSARSAISAGGWRKRFGESSIALTLKMSPG